MQVRNKQLLSSPITNFNEKNLCKSGLILEIRGQKDDQRCVIWAIMYLPTSAVKAALSATFYSSQWFSTYRELSNWWNHYGSVIHLV